MEHTYTRPLSDEELRRHLDANDTVVFKDAPVRWQEIERQVERLGFGERFIVSSTKGKHGRACKIRPVTPSV